MHSWLVAFITGLTAGGLSCMAVQGGLLTSVLASQTVSGGFQKRQSPSVWPILWFLSAKLVAYSVLGALLGALGSMLQLTATLRALLLMAIGIFMLGNGLRMLKVHPIFRYFAFEPPAYVTRYLRRKSKQGAEALTPLWLGAMTVFIPCGVTQAMMALALSTGDVIQAAGLMAAFTLGSNIVFFSVAYLALRLGSLAETVFARGIAILLLVLGAVSIDSGLNLLGAPFSLTRFAQTAGLIPRATPSSPAIAATPLPEQESNDLRITVLNTGYFPERLSARAGVPTRLTFVTDKVFSCSRALVIPEQGIEQVLPDTGEVTFTLPPQPAGKVLRYSCSMGMYTGQIVFNHP